MLSKLSITAALLGLIGGCTVGYDVGRERPDAGPITSDARAPFDTGWPIDTGSPIPDARTSCGSSSIEEGETCDDGNVIGGDGCDASCGIEPHYQCPSVGAPCELCGDRSIDSGERCDDGNTATGDGCDEACGVEPGWYCSRDFCAAAACGDGVQAGAEACDDANRRSGDGCDFRCAIEPHYECITAGIACRRAVCGDSAVENGEQCDDGNTVPSDGCDSACQLVEGFDCPRPGAPCVTERCGNGALGGLEVCDDGNVAPLDGCSPTCRLETGWRCAIAGARCTRTTCGDGRLEGLESCDDGALGTGDGCAADCTVEPLYSCSGSPSGCRLIAQYAVIREFPAPFDQAQAITYDPDRRSFTAHPFIEEGGNAFGLEFCMDGWAVPGEAWSPFRDESTGVDGAAYDPFRDTLLFAQQNGRVMEWERLSRMALPFISVPLGSGPEYDLFFPNYDALSGITVGDDGQVFVSHTWSQTIDVLARDPSTGLISSTPVATFSASTSALYLDTVFNFPGTGLLGHIDEQPGFADHEVFTVMAYDGTVLARADFGGGEGGLVVNGTPLIDRADGVDAATDGGSILICNEYYSGPSGIPGVCRLLAHTCATDRECADRIPGTECHARETLFGADVRYCYAPARAVDDSYRVSSRTIELDVLTNDSVGEAVCRGTLGRVTSVSPTSEGGTVAVRTDGSGVSYTAPAAARDGQPCGYYDTFSYSANLGGAAPPASASVRVLVACECGDGIRQFGEECDEGVASTNCDAFCRFTARCGNGRVDAGETCDDGNQEPGDGCSPLCLFEFI